LIDIAQEIAVLLDSTKDTSREKRLAKHTKYNKSDKGRLRYRRYAWKQNKKELVQRIAGKQEQILMLERELQECQKSQLLRWSETRLQKSLGHLLD
jgi:uncharacterized UPF0160 family protein